MVREALHITLYVLDLEPKFTRSVPDPLTGPGFDGFGNILKYVETYELFHIFHIIRHYLTKFIFVNFYDLQQL